MKKGLLIVLLSLVAALPGLGQKPKYVVLISIDGFRPEFYLDTSWPAPNLQQIVKEGVHAEAVRSVFPSVTYPAHTTLVTGALPARHGIFHNAPFRHDSQDNGWYWEEKEIQTTTLWDAVRQAGLTSASVYWPVSVGAPIDYNIPVIRPSNNQSGTQLSLTRQVATPKGLLEEVEKNATGTLTEEIFNNDGFIMDENIGRMAAYLISRYQPSLTTLHLISVDHVAHAEGREGKRVKQAVALADRVVGSIREAIERRGMQDSTALIVTGDHGFVNIHTALAPNVWLAQQGLFGKKDDQPWSAKFHTSGSAFLYLKNQSDPAVLEQVQRMLDVLPASQKKLFRVIDRQGLDEIGADPAAALALAPVPGVIMIGASQGEVIRPSGGKGGHGYFPDFPEIHTGFIGCGAGFRQDIVLPWMGLEDIASIVAHLLGIPFQAPDRLLYPKLLDTNETEK